MKHLKILQIAISHNEHRLSDERITEIYKTLSYLRKKAQVLVLCCRPNKEKMEEMDRLSKLLSQLKEETENFPPVDALTLRFNHTQNVIENARQDVVLNERRHRDHEDDEQSQVSDSEEETTSNSSGWVTEPSDNDDRPFCGTHTAVVSQPGTVPTRGVRITPFVSDTVRTERERNHTNVAGIQPREKNKC